MEPLKVEITVDATLNESSIDDYGYEPEVVAGFKRMKRKHPLWGWCDIEVIAKIGNLEASAYLSACSYKSEEDFRQEGGDFNDLKDEALDYLERNICKAEETIAAYREQYPKKETP